MIFLLFFTIQIFPQEKHTAFKDDSREKLYICVCERAHTSS